MKTVEMAKATRSLSEYAREVGDEAVVVVRNGKPVAVLSSAKGMDAESIASANNPQFAKIIQQSRRRQAREGGIDIAEIRRSFGLDQPRSRRR
jgi:prevent-host-death family protein